MSLVPVLVWVSEGAAGAEARAQAIALARALEAPLVGVHVLPMWTAAIADGALADAVSQQAFDASARAQGEALLQAAGHAAAAAGVPWRPLLQSGKPVADTLCDAAAALRCRLLVVGTTSHNAVGRLLLGDPVPALISHAPVPVLVCKP